MLITTALACNDRETAELCHRNLRDNAKIVMELGALVPYTVVRDLSDLTDLNPNAVQEAKKMYSDVWQQ